MRMPRVRFTVRRMMVVVVVVAGVTALLRRPYPVSAVRYPTGVKSPDGCSEESLELEQHWSNGRLQPLNTGALWFKDPRRYGPLLRIEWSDGTNSYYLDAQ